MSEIIDKQTIQLGERWDLLSEHTMFRGMEYSAIIFRGKVIGLLEALELDIFQQLTILQLPLSRRWY